VEGGGLKVEGRGRRAGFTIVELMVVILVIGVLITLLLSGIYAVRKNAYRREAELTLENMKVGIINLKRNCQFETVLGVYTSGRTVASDNKFQDTLHDFGAAGIGAGAKLYIIGGAGASGMPRNITGVTPHELAVDGAPFATGETNLEYYIVKAGGTAWPTLDIAKELEPGNQAWSSTYVPHINGRRMAYFTCKKGRIVTTGGVTNYTDPWGKPYHYRLRWLDLNSDGTNETLLEEILSSGEDTAVNDADDKGDFVKEVSRLRVGG